MLTVNYTVGHDYHRYRETTIFGKDEEQLIDHRTELGISMRQPWGSLSAVMNFSAVSDRIRPNTPSARSAAPISGSSRASR